MPEVPAHILAAEFPRPQSRSPGSTTSDSSISSTGTVIPPPSFTKPSKKSDLSSLPATDFFDEILSVDAGGNTFTVYYLRPTPPEPSSKPDEKPMLYVTHHGAGSSGLSFAALARALKSAHPEVGMLSFDCRGHGSTIVRDGKDEDFSLETLGGDFISATEGALEQLGFGSDGADLILVGHSLGGAVVVDVAKGGKLGKKILGYAVLDVVEGSAVEALSAMETYLESRPRGFKGLEEGIDWHVRSRTVRNVVAARVSVPALLKEVSDPPSPTQKYIWRTDLAKTQKFWDGWFKGLSSKFLSARGGKLLVLAGTDRLDKELMIGQMMGKYQLVVLPEAGHFLHEDCPEKVASRVSI